MKNVLSLLAVMAISSLAYSQVTDGLVGYFTFNEGSFTDLAGYQDCVISANGDSTYYLTDDRFGNSGFAIDFQGAVLNAGLLSRDIGSEVSVSLWMKTTAFSEDAKFVINKYYCIEPPQGYHLLTAGTSASFGGRDNTSNGYMYSGGSEAIVNDGEWHHLVGVARAEGIWEIWVDAQLENSNVFAPLSSLNHPFCNLGISGPNHTNDTNIYRGVLDDIRIYNKALNNIEIDSLFNEANPVSFGVFDPAEYSFDYKLYPNPVLSIATFSYELPQSEVVQLDIYNQLGILVFHYSGEQIQGLQQVQWEAQGQPEGMYFYQLRVGDQTANGKLLKVK